jgi:hypothetical protein
VRLISPAAIVWPLTASPRTSELSEFPAVKPAVAAGAPSGERLPQGNSTLTRREWAL